MDHTVDSPEWSAQGPVIELSAERCWSVTAKGTALVEEASNANRAAEDALPPWNPVTEYNFVEILPSSITGRQFEHHVSAVRRSDNGTLSPEL